MVATVTIPKKEYLRLKKEADLNVDLLRQFKESLEDVKAGRIHRVV